MKKYILSVCIASYNRKNIIVPDIKSYFSIEDQRFIVTVQDDGSNNGTYEELESIDDPRLKLRKNPQNLGAILNAKAALDNNPESEYILNLNDKDKIDISILPQFIDYLEKEKPIFGYVDLSNNKPFSVTVNYKGKDAILKNSYLCSHPSGFFWNSDMFHEEINKDYFKKLPIKFDYQFDLLFAHFAEKYSGVIVYLPLIINANMRPELANAKTMTYDESNIFFGASKRIETFCIFLRDIHILNIELSNKRSIAFSLAARTCSQVSTSLRNLMHNPYVCDHYNLSTRNVSLVDMIRNLNNVVKIYISESRMFETVVPLLFKSIIILSLSYLRAMKIAFKELFVKPTFGPIKL